ncbi:glycosyltransferase family 2 protein [Candidatus Saccharibacteria bacterium]|nr:glycosyltransferase family 2 protein [Candidatus Saccharibacteria bacterium]
MSKKPLTLSIIIPVYNEEDYIGACLDSVANQTIKPLEVIVVDNNSTDRTVEIARSYKFVKIIHEKKQGVFFAARTGFDIASGDIICRIDADTVLPAKWLARVLDNLEDGVFAATTGPVSYYDMPMPHSNYRFDHMMRYYTYKFAPKNPFLYGSDMAVRRSAWKAVEHKLCQERDIHEDVDLAVHLYQGGYRILYDKKLLARASGRRYNDSPRKFISYIAMYRRTYKHHGLPTLQSYPGMFMWSLGYALVHPWIKLWYRHLDKTGWHLPYSHHPRKNPMH